MIQNHTIFYKAIFCSQEYERNALPNLRCWLTTSSRVIILDSNLQIQSYKIQVQLKPKLHQLWRIALWLGELQPSVFLMIVWVFWLEHAVPSFVIAFEQVWSKRVLRADRKADVNQTCPQSVFSPIRTCIRVWCTVGAVEQRSQMFVYRPFRFSLHLVPPSTKGLFTGYPLKSHHITMEVILQKNGCIANSSWNVKLK